MTSLSMLLDLFFHSLYTAIFALLFWKVHKLEAGLKTHRDGIIALSQAMRLMVQHIRQDKQEDHTEVVQ